MFEIEYYEETDKCPVLDFIEKLTPKEQAKILREIDLLAEFGLVLGMPHIRKIIGYEGLWELRIKHSSNNFRIFYFTYNGGIFILLHGIRKLTGKTPVRSITTAMKRMKSYLKGREKR